MQTYVIEGPGMRTWSQDVQAYVDGKLTFSTDEFGPPHQCVSLDGYSLKVYTTRDLSNFDEGTPIDGVVRNVVFTDTATDTTIQSQCSVPPMQSTTSAESVSTKPCGCYAKDEEIQVKNAKCILDLGSISNIQNDWELEFEAKFNDYWTTHWWIAHIITGLG